jgi:lactate racemase
MRSPSADDLRYLRVPYGDQELEFMVQPYFQVDSGASEADPYDIVIAGVGAPADRDLYGAVDAAMRVRFFRPPVIREGGAVIVPARLDDGAGDGATERAFFEALQRAGSTDALLDARAGHVAKRVEMLVRALQNSLIVIAASEAPEVVRLARLRAAVDVEEGLDIAYEHIGRPPQARVLLVPRVREAFPEIDALDQRS